MNTSATERRTTAKDVLLAATKSIGSGLGMLLRAVSIGLAYLMALVVLLAGLGVVVGGFVGSVVWPSKWTFRLPTWLWSVTLPQKWMLLTLYLLLVLAGVGGWAYMDSTTSSDRRDQIQGWLEFAIKVVRRALGTWAKGAIYLWLGLRSLLGLVSISLTFLRLVLFASPRTIRRTARRIANRWQVAYQRTEVSLGKVDRWVESTDGDPDAGD